MKMELNEAIERLNKAGLICEADESALMKKLSNFIHKYRLTKHKVSAATMKQWVDSSMQDKMEERPCLSILDYLYDLTKNPAFNPQKDNPNTVDMFYEWEDLIDEYYEEWFQDQ